MSAITKTKVAKKLSRNMVLNKSRSDDLNSVTKLDLWGQGVSDVSLLEEMPSLEIVSITSNHISSLESFRHCSNLRELYLRNNRIEKLEEITYLKNLPNLEKMWLTGNPCTLCDKYRSTVVKTLPNLKHLDNIAITEEEKMESENSGVALEILPEMEDYSEQSVKEKTDSVDPSPTQNQNMSSSDVSLASANSTLETEYQLPNSTEAVKNSVYEKEECNNIGKSSGFIKPSPNISVHPPSASAVSVPEGNSGALSLEETNRLRVEIGLKPLPSSSVDIEFSTQNRLAQFQPSNNHEKDVRQAVFYLIKVLDKESLLFIGEAISSRLSNEFNDHTFTGSLNFSSRD